MVLDNATDTQQDEFVREDRYDGGESMPLTTNQFAVNSPPNTIVLSFDSLPVTFKPKDRNGIANTVVQQVESAAKLMARPVKMEEAQAFLENVAYATSLRKTGNYVGVSCAVGWAGWSTYRTYQRQANELQQALKRNSPSQKKSIIQLTRPFWRPWALLPLIVVGTMTFVQFNVTASLVVREMRDPRLANYKQAIDTQFRQRSSITGRQQDTSSTTQSETFEQRRQRQSMQDMIRRSRGREQSTIGADDASPTAGSPDQSWNDSAIQPSNADSFAQSTIARGSGDGRNGLPQTSASSTRESTSDFYDFGDTSTSSSSPAARSPSPSTPGRSSGPVSPSTSTWERLRQEALNNSKGNK